MIIGVSGLAKSGKSEVAKRLEARFGFTRHAFADPLKAMLAQVGFTHAQLYGDEKERHLPEFGHTSRDIMISLGTAWGRRMVHRDFWVKVWGRTLPAKTAATGRAVAEDVRFPNEVRAIKDRGGFIIRVVRPGIEPTPRWGFLGRLLVKLGLKFPIHPSERVDRIPYDIVIYNDGSVEDLERKIDHVARTLIGQAVEQRAAELKAEREKVAA